MRLDAALFLSPTLRSKDVSDIAGQTSAIPIKPGRLREPLPVI
jgi:hypothetical protein